ncbi:MAG: hypothetical protein V4655_06690 [Bdellovibrionota bacterium]|nr:MAG: hypothetical protein EOP10_07910 [Pseudomonadota bacterium]
MDASSNAKIQPGKIVTRIDEIDTTIEVRFSDPVDPIMLSQFLSLGEVAKDQLDQLAEVGHTLKNAQRCVTTADKSALDALAQQLTHSALKIGAPKLLSSAIEIQGLARIGDFRTAAELLGRMEVELVEVRAHYS